jgi:hypothetical protein
MAGGVHVAGIANVMIGLALALARSKHRSLISSVFLEGSDEDCRCALSIDDLDDRLQR